MATIKNTNVVSNITNSEGLNSTRVSTSDFPYGDYSVANVAMVMNTVNTLASHIYSNFIPNDRIIPDKYKISEDADDSNIIFYKSVDSTDGEVSVTDKDDKDFLKYLITGQVLRDNIEFHKPKINGTYDYDQTFSFLLDTDPGDGNYAGRNNTIYCWQNGASSASWLGAKVNPNYVDTSITSSGISIKIDNQLKHKKSTDATSFSIAESTGESIELFDSNFNKYNFSFKDTGLLSSFVNTGTANILTKKEITDSESSKIAGNEYELTVYIPGTNNEVSQATLKFSKFGILQSVVKADSIYKLIKKTGSADTSKKIDVLVNSFNADGTLQYKELQFDTDGVFKSMSSSATDVSGGNKTINGSNQTFATGLKTFSGGIGLPSNTAGSITLS